MSSFRSQDFCQGIVVVSSCWVDGDSGGFVDDNQTFIFVYDSYRLGGDGGFVAVEGMADDISILDDCLGGWDGFAIQVDGAAGDCALLGVLVLQSILNVDVDFYTYIVLCWSISEFILENLQNLPSTPALFAVCVVGEVIGSNSSQSQFLVEFIRARPGITRGCDDCGRRGEDFW